MDIFHHGNGIFQFDNIIDFEDSELVSYINELEKLTKPEGYSNDDGRTLNSGGYEHAGGTKSLAPIRYIDTVFPGISEEHKQFVRKLEKALYDAVVVYCKYFPVVTTSIKWRTRGYIIKYLVDQMIGPHSDATLPYQKDGITPLTHSPLANTLTCSMTLNNDFTGGEIGFRPWGIVVPPQRGRLVVYPSNFIGCHEIYPIKSGIRYGYLAWFCQGSIDGSPSPLEVNDVLDYKAYFLPRLAREVGERQQFSVPLGSINPINWKQ